MTDFVSALIDSLVAELAAPRTEADLLEVLAA
ncbi:MAG: hypothetical protein JWO22_3848 [Frankiales bacterium]|nr:hypothetical protein [Frankiales bacterium]